jgi:hypothetical protein
MATDYFGASVGPVGLTVPPPSPQAPRAEEDSQSEQAAPAEPAPLPPYKGSVVDESV